MIESNSLLHTTRWGSGTDCTQSDRHMVLRNPTEDIDDDDPVTLHRCSGRYGTPRCLHAVGGLP